MQSPLSLRMPFAAALCLSLAACAGTEDVVLPDAGDLPVTEDTYEQFFDDSAVLLADVATAPPTDAAALPTTGSADYVGIAGLSSTPIVNSYEDAELLGRIDLTANFADDTVTGVMQNFRDPSNTDFEGQIAVTDGQIVGSTFEADFAGTLTNPTGSAELAGVMVGGFVGSEGEQMRGAMTGTSTVPAGSYPIYGAFVAVEP